MGSRLPFTPDQEQFIKDNAKDYKSYELVEIINNKMGGNVTQSQVQGYCRRRKIKLSHKAWNKYSDDKVQFLIDNQYGISRKELTDLFNAEFNTNSSVEAIKCYCNKLDLSNGIDTNFKKGHTPYSKGKKQEEYMSKEAIERSKQSRFKKGNKPLCERPIGSEWVDKKSNTTYVKVSMEGGKRFGPDGNWIPKGYLIWEEYYHEKVPQGMYIIYLDKDPQNLNINNLELVSKAEHSYLNVHKKRTNDSDLTRSNLYLRRLKASITKRSEENEE